MIKVRGIYMAKRKKPNWDEINTEYATTDISYREIANKHGIPYRTVVDAGRSQEWVKARETYRSKFIAKSIDLAANERAKHLQSIASSADKMANVIHSVMDDTEQFFRRIDMTTGEEKISKKVDSKAVRELTAAMKDLTAVLRNVYDIPTQAEQVSMELARERLEIERKKAQQEEEFISNGGGIVLLPPLNEEDTEE
jgi:hypothetical protein